MLISVVAIAASYQRTRVVADTSVSAEATGARPLVRGSLGAGAAEMPSRVAVDQSRRVRANRSRAAGHIADAACPRQPRAGAPRAVRTPPGDQSRPGHDIALGATTRNVTGLVVSQSLRPVGIGLVAGGGLAAALAIGLTSTPAAAEIGNLVHVFDPVAYTASVLVIVTACVLAASVPPCAPPASIQSRRSERTEV